MRPAVRASANFRTRSRMAAAPALVPVAFGTDVGGCPLDEAARIGVGGVRAHLAAGGSGLERVVFAVRGAEARAASETALAAG